MNKKQLTHWFLVIVIGIALGLGLQFVRAWTEPTTAPPNGNVGAPINTSANSQTKTGGITAGTLTAATVTGTTQLCIGTDCRKSWPGGGTQKTPTGGCTLDGAGDTQFSECDGGCHYCVASSFIGGLARAWDAGTLAEESVNGGTAYVCRCNGICCETSPCTCY